MRGEENEIALFLPYGLLPFFLPPLPCLSACYDTSLVTHPLTNYRYHRLRRWEVLHFAGNSLPDLSSSKSSVRFFSSDFSDERSSTRSNALLAITCFFPSQKNTKKPITEAIHNHHRTRLERTLVFGVLDWLNCYNKWIVLIPNKEALLL